MSSTGKRTTEERQGAADQPPTVKQRSIAEDPLPRACFSCYTSKIKCDRATPCGRCRRLGLACLPNPGVPRRRNVQKSAGRASGPVKQEESPPPLQRTHSSNMDSECSGSSAAFDPSEASAAPFVVPRGPPEAPVLQAGDGVSTFMMWQADISRNNGRQALVTQSCSAAEHAPCGHHLGLPLVQHPPHHPPILFVQLTEPAERWQQQQHQPEQPAVFRPPAPLQFYLNYAPASSLPSEHPAAAPMQPKPHASLQPPPVAPLPLDGRSTPQSHHATRPPPPPPPPLSPSSSPTSEDDRDDFSECSCDSPFAEAIQGLIDTYGNLCPLQANGQQQQQPGALALPPLALPPQTQQPSSPAVGNVGDQAVHGVTARPASFTMSHGEVCSQVVHHGPVPPPAAPTQIPAPRPPHAHLRNLAHQIFPHLLQQSHVQVQAQAHAQAPVPLLSPARPLPSVYCLSSGPSPLPPPPATLDPGCVVETRPAPGDVMMQMPPRSPIERKLSEASTSAGAGEEGPDLPYSPTALARYVAAWDPESVLRDKSKAVLRSWRLWNLAQGMDTTYGLLDALSTALELDDEAKLWERQYVHPPKAMLDAGRHAIHRRMEPLWALGPEQAVCAVAISGNLVTVHTNNCFEHRFGPRNAIQDALITEGLQPFHYWARLMGDKESAQSFYRVAVEAAFQGNPSITSTHALMAMSAWEDALPTSDTQLERISKLEQIARGLEGQYEEPTNQHFSYGRLGSPSTVPGGDKAHLDELLQAINAELPAEEHPLEAAAGQYTEVIDGYREKLEGFGEQVGLALECLQDIESRYQSVSSKAESLNGICETLLAEQRTLEQRRRLLSGPMEFFDELERLGPLLGLQGGTPSAANAAPAGRLSSGSSPGGLPSSLVRAQPGSEEFLEVLKRIDQAIEFFLQHPQYRDSTAYLAKMRQLQARGLGLVRTQILHHLEAASKAASSKKAFENLETSLIYSKFRSIATRVRDQVNVITDRLDQAPEHTELLEECKKSYTQKRWLLLKPVIRAHLEGVAKSRETASLARTGAAVLTRICQLETQLYDTFFGAPEEESNPAEDGFMLSMRRRAGSHEFYSSGELYQLLLGLCLLLRDLLRPMIIHDADLEDLCQLINVVKDEILEGQSTLRGVWGMALEVVLDKIAKDAQERLIYSAQKVMRVEIEMFRPTAADLDYPKKLQDYQEAVKAHHRQTSSLASLSEIEGASAPAVAADPSGASVATTPTTAGSPTRHASQSSTSSLVTTTRGSGPVPIYAAWFPTLHITLTLLSKIYRAVEIHVFQDMAHQALSACNESLLAAAKVLRETRGNIDADLFLIKHLLILREQLVPFDIEFAGVERRLDFKSTRGALTKFFVDTRNMFRMGTDNALIHLAMGSIPTVYEDEVDSKRQLEESLKWACNSFIQHASNSLADGLISLLKMIEAFLPPDRTAPSPEQAARAQQLKSQPFVQLERVKETLLTAHEAIATSTPTILRQMSLYLDNNAATKAILFKPVRLRVLGVSTALREHLLDVMGPNYVDELEGLLAAIRGSLSRMEFENGEVLPPTPVTGAPPPSPWPVQRPPSPSGVVKAESLN